jgi:hypothetical protein
LYSPVTGRVDRIGHLVQIRRSLGGIESVDAQDRVGGPADRIVNRPDGTADATRLAATGGEHLVTAVARVAAAARAPTCLWADQSIPAAIGVRA